MSDVVVQQIADELETHDFVFDWDNVRHACSCGQWCDSGPSEARVRHNYREHVADELAARLNLHEERAVVTDMGHRTVLHAERVAWLVGKYDDMRAESRWVTDWTPQAPSSAGELPDPPVGPSEPTRGTSEEML